MKQRREKILDLICLLIMVVSLLDLVINWKALGSFGNDATSKESIVILTMITWFMFGGLTFAETLPQRFMSTSDSFSGNEQLILEIQRMLQAHKLAVVILFSFLTIRSSGIHLLPGFLLPLVALGAILIIVFSILRLKHLLKTIQ